MLGFSKFVVVVVIVGGEESYFALLLVANGTGWQSDTGYAAAGDACQGYVADDSERYRD
jgi:hypothetical protein